MAAILSNLFFILQVLKHNKREHFNRFHQVASQDNTMDTSSENRDKNCSEGTFSNNKGHVESTDKNIGQLLPTG